VKATPRLNDDQIAPPEDWRTWVLLGGRGSGKTFAGGFWMNELARGADMTFALVGTALHDVREVMVEGPSGLKAQATADNRPRWEAGRRRLVWPSGAAAYAFSAEDPDSLRGPQFHAAWADEFCAWRNIEATLSNLRFGLRLGADPKLAITTTPRPIPALRRLLSKTGASGVRMLHQHESRAVVGVWDRMVEDERGLWVEGRIEDWSAEARYAAALTRAGALDGLSIGFRATKARREGRLRVLSRAELWEVSLVTFPMLPGARFQAQTAAG